MQSVYLWTCRPVPFYDIFVGVFMTFLFHGLGESNCLLLATRLPSGTPVAGFRHVVCPHVRLNNIGLRHSTRCPTPSQLAAEPREPTETTETSFVELEEALRKAVAARWSDPTEAFKALDEDGNGTLEFEELQVQYPHPGLEPNSPLLVAAPPP